MFDKEVSAICLPGFQNLTDANAALTKWGTGDYYYERYTVDRIRESQVRDLVLVISSRVSSSSSSSLSPSRHSHHHCSHHRPHPRPRPHPLPARILVESINITYWIYQDKFCA